MRIACVKVPCIELRSVREWIAHHVTMHGVSPRSAMAEGSRARTRIAVPLILSVTSCHDYGKGSASSDITEAKWAEARGLDTAKIAQDLWALSLEAERLAA
jgi:hypothetical protein